MMKMLKEKIVYKDGLPINVTTANINEYPIHFHDDMEVVYVLDGKGILRIPSDDYAFTYIVHSNKLYIDFEDEDSIDLNFIFSFENGDLVLQGIKESSGTYRFKRVEE